MKTRHNHKGRGADTDTTLPPTDPLLTVNHGKCFIDLLPPELLSRIFTEILNSSIYCWEFVEHVCSSWRKIALGIPSLWTSITVTLEINLEKLQLELARSGDLPLSILVHLTRECDFLGRSEPTVLNEAYQESTKTLLRKSFSGRPQVLETLRPTVYRWRAFELHSNYRDHANEFCWFLAKCPPPPQLQSFVLHDSEYPSLEGFVYRPDLSPPFGNALLPSLTYAEIESLQTSFSGWKLLRGLTSLSYGAPQLKLLVADPILATLRQSPRLEKLNISWVYPECKWDMPRNLPTSKSITLTHLTTLSLTHMYAHCARTILEKLVLPNLRNLTLKISETFDESGDRLLQYLTSPSSGGSSVFSRVEVLTLSGGCDDMTTSIAAARELQELTKLKLDLSILDDIWLYLLAQPNRLPELLAVNIEPGAIFFPNLRSLHMKFVAPETAIKVAQKRLEQGVPLEELRLSATFPLSERQHEYLSRTMPGLKVNIDLRNQWRMQNYYQEPLEPKDESVVSDLTEYSSLRHKERGSGSV